MEVDPVSDVIERLVDSGLDFKEARVVATLAGRSPQKASEIGALVSISRMDAYNTLKRLQERGLIRSTVDKPMRFTCEPIAEIFRHIIHHEEEELRRIKEHLESLSNGPNRAFIISSPESSEPSFTVVKDNTNIHASLERIIDDSEVEIWLLLGEWGILRLVKTGALRAVNEAAQRGIEVKCLAKLNPSTMKFFDELDSTIEIRHCDVLSMVGCMVDGEVAIQMVSQDSNPLSRGKEDSALLIESESYISAQLELVSGAWLGAQSQKVATARIVEGTIVEPLRVTLGEGSFYQRLKDSLSKRILAEGGSEVGWTNAILRREGSPIAMGEKSTFEALGVDVDELMRMIGRRIGEEIAWEFRAVEDDERFWKELTQLWQELGMGALEVEGEPINTVTVKNSGSCGGEPKIGSGLCHLDEGVLEGIISERLNVEVSAVERDCTSLGKNQCSFDISLIKGTI